MRIAVVILLLAGRSLATGAEEWRIPHVAGAPALSLDPEAWRRHGAAHARIDQECTRATPEPDLAATVFGFWTDTDVHFLFVVPYRKLHLWSRSAEGRDRDKLWERDVVEIFLGDDWKNINRYREFELAPTGERIDLAIDLARQSYDRSWNSGWTTRARIDAGGKRWYAAMSIPLESVTGQRVAAGTRWRTNLYLICGPPPDSSRRFLCWRPTRAPGRDPNHVPERFGTLVFGPGKE